MDGATAITERKAASPTPSRPNRTTDSRQLVLPRRSLRTPQSILTSAAESLFATIRRRGGGGVGRGRGRSGLDSARLEEKQRRKRETERERERKEESGGTIEAKQNTGEEKGRGRERPSDPLAGCWSSLEREVVEQYGRGFLKRPKVKAILSRKPRCQCRPGRATLAAAGAAAARRQGLFNATSNSTRGRKEGRKEGRSERRSWY